MPASLPAVAHVSPALLGDLIRELESDRGLPEYPTATRCVHCSGPIARGDADHTGAAHLSCGTAAVEGWDEDLVLDAHHSTGFGVDEDHAEWVAGDAAWAAGAAERKEQCRLIRKRFPKCPVVRD